MASPAAHTAHHAPQGFIRKWVFSVDHKVIGIQYYFLGLFSVFLGMLHFLLLMHASTWSTPTRWSSGSPCCGPRPPRVA